MSRTGGRRGREESGPAVKKIFCLGLENPIGITQTPVFSFAPAADFTAVRVRCTAERSCGGAPEVLWDARIETRDCFGIEYAGRKLGDCERVFYQIGCYDGERFGGLSAPNCFETGISHDNFTAEWVFDPGFSGASPIFLEAFELEKPLESARLYVTGLGYFDAFLNGEPLDDAYFKPVVTVYDDRPLDGITPYFFNRPEKTVYYHTYDVTARLLRQNVLAVLAGGGWYHNIEKELEGNYSYGTPRAVYELRLKFSDGSERSLRSGGETRLSTSYIRSSTLFKGEAQDFRYPVPESLGFGEVRSLPRAGAAKRPAGTMTGNIWPTDRVVEGLEPVRSWQVDGKTLFDFGTNHSGVVRIEANGGPGATFIVRTAEELDARGGLDHLSTGWNYLIQTDACTLAGGRAVFSPKFTFHGYRYAEIEWVSEGGADGTPGEILRVSSLVISSDVARSGAFRCSERMLNDIETMYVRTQRNNLHGCIPSDCPHREKRGFTGDGQVTCASAMCALDMRGFYRKWMRDIVGCQDPETGSVPHTAPYSGGGCSPGFGAAIAVLPLQYAKYYADLSLLKAYLPNILGWISYLDRQHEGDCIVTREEREWSLGEWMCPDRIDIPPEYVKTYFFSKCCTLALEAMRLTGDRREEARILALRQRVNDSLKKRFFDGSDFCGDKNGANLFALDAGVLTGEARERLAERTAARYRADPRIDTGIFGTRLLFDFLTEHGCRDVALRMATSIEHPSYGYMLANGATTLWECWEKTYTPDFWTSKENFMKGYPASHDHPMLGSVVAWLYECVGGLNFSEFAETRTVVLDPKFAPLVPECECSQLTTYGMVSLRYRYHEGRYTRFEAKLPPNTRGRAMLGDRIVELSGGRHRVV